MLKQLPKAWPSSFALALLLSPRSTKTLTTIYMRLLLTLTVSLDKECNYVINADVVPMTGLCQKKANAHDNTKDLRDSGNFTCNLIKALQKPESQS